MHLISYDNNSISTIYISGFKFKKKNGCGVIRIGEKIIRIGREVKK